MEKGFLGTRGARSYGASAEDIAANFRGILAAERGDDCKTACECEGMYDG